MKKVVRIFVLVAVGVISVARAGQAAPVLYTAFDPDANSLAEMPTSQTAADAFDIDAALLGSMSLADFESSALGALGAGLDLGDGASVAGGTSSIANAPVGAPEALFGFNTTAGGQNYVSVFGGDLIFSFAAPIQAFGAYITGIQESGIAAQETLVVHYTDGSTAVFNIPNRDLLFGGGAFVGIIDAGASIDSVTLHFLNDITGVDDVRFGPTAVPEPASLLLMGAGLLGLAARRRRHTPTV